MQERICSETVKGQQLGRESTYVDQRLLSGSVQSGIQELLNLARLRGLLLLVCHRNRLRGGRKERSDGVRWTTGLGEPCLRCGDRLRLVRSWGDHHEAIRSLQCPEREIGVKSMVLDEVVAHSKTLGKIMYMSSGMGRR